MVFASAKTVETVGQMGHFLFEHSEEVMLRILIADDHEVARRGIRAVLESHPGWEVCAEAKDGQILLSQRVNVALKCSVATEQVGALTLKGLTQPVVAYNVPLPAGPAAFRVIEGGATSA